MVKLVTLLLTSMSLVSSFHHRPLRTTYQKKGLSASTVGRAEWADDETGLRDAPSRRKLSGPFLDNLNWVVGTLLTRYALNTVSYYMIEFHDEVNEKWMMGFGNYRKSGDFPDGLWTNYIEKMIMTDKLQVEVLMTATKASLRSRKIPEGRNIMMQYFHDLEPRKIAHQIITVREDVSSEMIQDLGCIRLENEEAVRFASTWAREGRAAAEKSRKVTRMREYDESTPKRDINYMDFNVMVSALAVQLVREDLIRNKETAALHLMDELTTKLGDDDDSFTMEERLQQESHGPRSFMEQLYHKGVIGGVTKSGLKSVNMLKVAESFLDARLAISKEASKLISLQSMQNRHYYKMIKDHGGFQKLDMSSGVPKMRFVDLDLQALEDAKEEAAEALLKSTAESVPVNAPVTELETVAPTEFAEVAADSDISESYGGPMMM